MRLSFSGEKFLATVGAGLVADWALRLSAWLLETLGWGPVVALLVAEMIWLGVFWGLVLNFIDRR